jgi:hypothetical protein
MIMKIKMNRYFNISCKTSTMNYRKMQNRCNFFLINVCNVIIIFVKQVHLGTI